MINRVTLIGRLGHSPKSQSLPSGKFVCKFSLATSERWKDENGESREMTEWHNIVVWGRFGEICAEYLEKGKLVYIEGKIQTREWEGKDGTKKRTTEIIASEMKMLESKSVARESNDLDDDDIPF
jgi:single-strand DNA-binding protein